VRKLIWVTELVHPIHLATFFVSVYPVGLSFHGYFTVEQNCVTSSNTEYVLLFLKRQSNI